MAKKRADGWSESYPYDFYAYQEENHTCPECERKPMVFRVPTKIPAKRPCTEFTCAAGHKWIEEDKLNETHQCRWCEMEGVIETEHAGETIWWCEECLAEYNRDMIYQQWQNSDNKTGDL